MRTWRLWALLSADLVSWHTGTVPQRTDLGNVGVSWQNPRNRLGYEKALGHDGNPKRGGYR